MHKSEPTRDFDSGKRASRTACFALARPKAAPVLCRSAGAQLGPDAAAALAGLLPLLACGEEAATLSFEALSGDRGFDAASRKALGLIGREEARHEALIAGMQAALPPSRANPALLRRARALHMRIGRGDAVTRLVRIAALDSAVCTLLSWLLRPGRPLQRSPEICSGLSRIRSEEARHASLSRQLAMRGSGYPQEGMMEEAAHVRGSLAGLLEEAGDCFETLGVDMAALGRTLRQVPAGLFRA